MIQLFANEVVTDYQVLLNNLSDHDKLLRFGYMASAENIRSHIDSIQFSKTPVYGVYDPVHGLVAAVEIWKQSNVAEIGLVVSEKARGKGIGSTLFKNACVGLHAIGTTEIIIYVKSHNNWMRRIASSVGMTILHSSGGEIEYHLLYDGLPDYTSVVKLAANSTSSAINRNTNIFWSTIKKLFKL